MDIKIGTKFDCHAGRGGDPFCGLYSVVGFAVDGRNRVCVTVAHDVTGEVVAIMPYLDLVGWWMSRVNPRKYSFKQLGFRTN
jgi:hypothetical protein